MPENKDDNIVSDQGVCNRVDKSRVEVSDNFSRESSSLLILLFCCIHCRVRARGAFLTYIQQT